MARPLPPADAADDADEPTRLLEDLARLTGRPCAACAAALCGHAVLFSVALGHKDRPLCPACLARALGWPPAELREHLLHHVHARDCFRRAWAAAGEQEGVGPVPRPPCLGSPAGSAAPAPLPPGPAPALAAAAGESPTLVWDAGDLACGELVLELRRRLHDLPPGALAAVTARDPAAPEDLPAWCRLTGHRLVQARPPEYLIRRKES